MEVNNQIFMHKNSRDEILMFHVFSSIHNEYQKKSFSLLKNISENFI